MTMRILMMLFSLGLIVGLCQGEAPAQPTSGTAYHNPAMPGPDEALYWLDQGGLFATYGNYQAAVRAYTKALELDSNSSEGHFNLGLALAEMGQLDDGLARIEKALSLNSQEARYYYGRGRILLLAGQPAKALADFSRAADMGNTDALTFMARSKKAHI
jgi:tetratricopeptide (TPR) repeat protein